MSTRIETNPEYREAAEEILRLLENREQLASKRIVKSSMVRSVYHLQADGFTIFLKKYHSRSIVDKLKSLVAPSRAVTEWTAMNRLIDFRIPTAVPVIFGETRRSGLLVDSFFAALAIGSKKNNRGEEVEDALQFNSIVAWMKRREIWTDEIGDNLYGDLAELITRLHRRSVKHGDFHVGNIVAPRTEIPRPTLHVIDLHTVKFPSSLSRRFRLLNLAKLVEGIRYNSPEEVKIFLEKYISLNPDFAESAAALEKEIMQSIRRLDRRRIGSRTRRCLARSTEFSPARKDGCLLNLRRPFTPEEILGAIAVHDGIPRQGDDRLIYPSNKNKVTVVTQETSRGPTKLCVKEYRKLGFPAAWIPSLSEARRSWIAGRGLEVRLIDTPQTVAWVRKGGRHYLVTRFIDGAEKLFSYAARSMEGMEGAERAAFLRTLAGEAARFMRRLHDSGVRHGDMSEQNLLVKEDEGGRSLCLIDLDTVGFRRRLCESRIVKNLIQLGHLPAEIDVIQKARFLEVYLGESRAPEFRGLLRRINNGILERMAAKRMRYAKRGEPDPHPFPSRLKRNW